MFKRIQQNLSLKITVYVLIFVLVFVVSVSAVLFDKSVNSLREEAFGNLEQTTQSLANRMNIDITNTMQITNTLEALVSESFDREKLASDPEYLNKKVEEFKPYLRIVAQDFSLANTAFIYYNPQLDGAPHDIYFVDVDNDGIVARQQQLPVDYFTQGDSSRGEKDWWFGPIQARRAIWTKPYEWQFDDGAKRVFISHTKAIFNGETLVGVVGTDYSYKEVQEKLSSITLYQSGYAFLLNDYKQFLIHPEYEGMGLEKINDSMGRQLSNKLKSQFRGTYIYRRDNNEQWMVSYHTLQNGWVLGLEAPLSEVTRRATTLSLLTISVLAVCIPLLLVLSYLIARQISHPILELTAAVEDIENGQYAPLFSESLISREDELGHLGVAIKRMGVTIKESIEEISLKSRQLELETEEKNQAKHSFGMVYEAFSAASNGLVIMDAQFKIIHANPAFMKMVGVDVIEEGQKLDELFKINGALEGVNQEGSYAYHKLSYETPGEEQRYLELIQNRMESREGYVRYIVIVEDITEKVHQEENIDFLKHHDLLTGLFNKESLMGKMEESFARERIENSISALMTINIDDFRIINEAMGHDCGDYVIHELAIRLRKTLDFNNIVARGTGDDFLIYVQAVEHVQDLEAIAQKILTCAYDPISWRAKEAYITLSIGVAIYPFDAEGAENLVAYSTVALNHAKASGKDRVRYYSREMMEQSFERYELVNHLREALEREEFYLEYQPIMSLESMEPIGAEALIRWRHPEKGIISPIQFIPLAEASGFINRLGEWVIKEACQQLRMWINDGYAYFNISVNISSIQLHDSNFVSQLKDIVKAYNIPQGRLDIEVTESALMQRNSMASENLDHLKALGFPIHIDDFGTGFSSLSYLRNFHIDALKVDRSFIKDYPDHDTGEIAHLIINLGMNLGVKVIAEGIETQEQLNFIMGNGCFYGQGYLFGKPMAPEQIEKWIAEKHYLKNLQLKQ